MWGGGAVEKLSGGRGVEQFSEGEFFLERLRFFREGLRFFRDGLRFFSGGVEIFSVGLRNFRGLRNF